VATQLGDCSTDADCEDGNPCTYDECANAQCRFTTPPELADCCVDDVECDDELDCTVDACDPVTNLCVNEVPLEPIWPCCDVHEDCDDGNAYTVNYCTSEKECAGVGCKHFDCNDNNICTTDAFDFPLDGCKHTKIKDCCTMDKQCPADGECTLSYCNMATNECINLEIFNCCEEDSNCTDGGSWDDDDDCTLDLCIAGECRHIVTGDEC